MSRKYLLISRGETPKQPNEQEKLWLREDIGVMTVKTASEWTADNTVLGSGEQGYESDTGKLKIGNGATAWNSLSYFQGGSGGSTDPATIWTNLLYGFKIDTPPVLNASQPVSGQIWDYVYAASGGGTTTRYRLITSSEDSFYTNWDGTNATGLIATRELTI